MNDSTAARTIVIPGANGRVGQLLRRAWEEAPLNDWRPVWCARAPGPDIDMVWQPGEAVPLKADAVLALWGVVPRSGDLQDNVKLARAAMALGRDCGAQRVLHLSSAAVYGPGTRLHENMLCAPASDYGTDKLAMETAIAAEPGPDACALRLANVVGADSLFRSLESDAPMVIDRFANGQGPHRSYASPLGILRAVQALLRVEILPDVINVALPGTVSMDALAMAAGRVFDWRAAPEGPLAEVVLDTRRLQTLTQDKAKAEPDAIIAEWRRLRRAQA
ncbi:NAD-dependent epimerase/dehydratase family protein [Shimia sp.]|uniref:NAD-dependent epimerase/dehydratase family protein n=1 Tax=Shimia sp. TaxID=1954381 RepID=UPI0032975C8E